MKRFIFAAMVLTVAACGKKQETVAVPQAPAAPQETTQMTQPPVTAVPAAPATTSETAPPTTQPSSGSSAPEGSSGSSGTMGSSGAAGAGEYTVNAGDTLSGIAREHNLNSRDIANWNNIQNPNRIHKGQTLRLTAP